jgi:condensation domain-containing protein
MTTSEPLALLQEQAAATAPVMLEPAPPLRVPFAGRRGGEGPLTLGQANTLQWVGDPTLYTRMIEWTLTLPTGATLADIAAALSVLISRHESLRTTYPDGGGPDDSELSRGLAAVTGVAETGGDGRQVRGGPAGEEVAGRKVADGEPAQRVLQAGELSVEVYRTVGEPPGLGVLTVELAKRLRAREFDLTSDLPLRVAVATGGGGPLAVVAVYSHVAVDFGSMALIDQQFAELASDPASREPGPAGCQPLDQAEHERSPLGRRRAKTALQSWRSQLAAAPQCLYPVPAGDPAKRGDLACGWLWSPAAALALPLIATRTGASRQLAVLTALCAVLALRAGHDVCSLPVTVSNRSQQRLRGYVGTLANDGILTIDVRAARFDELVRRTAAATLRSNHSGPVDRADLIGVIAQIEHDRGISYLRACAFNDLTPYVPPEPGPAAAAQPAGDAAQPGGDTGPAGLRRALGRTRFAAMSSPPVEELLLIILHKIEPELSMGVMTRDGLRVSPAEIESLLRGVERLLVAAAARDVELTGLTGITGVSPMPRGPGWLHADSCWVELSEAQRLLDDALDVPAVRVFPDPAAPGEAALVAYLAAGGSVQTPEQAHAACVAELAGHGRPRRGQPRYTAMAPARYVICARAPLDRSDLTAWRQQPVLAAGTGRRPHG